MNENRRQKWGLHICIFVSIMALTFWSVFRNQDFTEMAASIQKLSMQYMAAAVLLAVFFVAGEGCMSWYLLKGIGERAELFRCISYSFIGFFFSGITPSATGGQPVQLYYMKKDGNKISSASVVLMAVAVIYKFVLALTGIGILLFWRVPLREYLKEYYWMYFLGLFLNITVVSVLLLVIGTPVLDIILRQASVYIAVDMLPVPGAQGITEAMYRAVFETVFPADCLVASICIIRGISFYLMMAVSFIVWAIMRLQKNR